MREKDESSPAAADNGDADGQEHAPPNDPPDGSTAAEEPAARDSESTQETPPEGDLPEWEPLTPELVEDEAIRGDFMLRWAAILLALLMGWTIIQETSVLTHVRTGQYLAGNGFLPPETDVFSSSASDRRWVNLSWMWDLASAGVYGVLGATGLSLLKALLAALTFWILSRISLPGLPTWWGSVCSVLALLAAFPDLTATPSIMTLLGTACLMWQLHRWTIAPESRLPWSIVLLLGVWCQFDDRAWIGAVILVAFTIGYWIDSKRSREKFSSEEVRSLALAAGSGLVVMLVHPFLWETLLSPLRLYELEYPTLRQYVNRDMSYLHELYPLSSSEFWERMNYFNAAGLLLWLMTLVTLVLNRERLRYSQLGAFLVVTGIGFAGGGELAVVGIVNAALATVNAQQWYQASFRQTYSVETSELLFSRAGRALTVAAFFALGFTMVSGHLTGTEGRRVGLGFDPQLQQTIASYEQVLDDSFDDRPFSFRFSQGDVLIWIGKQPFIDSRVRLFAAGPDPVVDEHLRLRPAMLNPGNEAKAEANRRLWQTAFDEYQITHVLPRLSGNSPDYGTFHDLNQSPDWTLTRLGAATAVFYRADSSVAGLPEYVAEHDASDIVQATLHSRVDEVEPPAMRVLWPRPPTVYEQYMYLPNQLTPNVLQEARHYLQQARYYSLQARELLFTDRPDEVGPWREKLIAAAYAAIRNTHAGLADSPNDLIAYHILGECYDLLHDFERTVEDEGESAATESLRNAQAISAYHHALLCDPQDVIAHYRLFHAFRRQQRPDLVLHHLEQIQQITGQLTLFSQTNTQFEVEQQRNNELFLTLSSEVAELQHQLGERLAAGEDRIQLVEELVASGYVLTALETLEGDLTVISGDPRVSFVYGLLLFQSGRTEEAHDQLQGLKNFAEMGVLPDWHTVSSLSQIAAEDLLGALATMEEQLEQLELASSVLLLRSGPLQATGPTGSPEDNHRTDPLLTVSQHTRSSRDYFRELLPRISDNKMRQALIHLELGDNQAAEDLFHDLLQYDPSSALRPVSELYLSLLTENPDIPPAPTEDEAGGLVLDLFDEFVPDDDPEQATDDVTKPVEKPSTDSQDSSESPSTTDPAEAAKPPVP